MSIWSRVIKSFTLQDGFPSISGQGRSIAGVSVNEHSALQLSAANSCLRLIVRTVGTLPLSVIRKEGDSRVVDDKHPLHYLLRYSPSSEQTPAEFKRALACAILRWGNSYTEKVVGAGGRLIALKPLDSEYVSKRYVNGVKEYHYTKNGQLRIFSEDQLMIARGFSFDGEDGATPIEYGAGSFASALAADKASQGFYEGGMMADGVLSYDKFLNAEQRENAEKNILRPFQGIRHSKRTMILEGGIQYKQLSINPEDAQLLDTRRFNIEEICRWYGVPPILIGHSQEGMTNWGSGIEQIVLMWLKVGLESQLNDIEEALSKSLLKPSERGTHQIKFNINKLLRADIKTRYEAYRMATAPGGWMMRNEARKHEDLAPIEGLDKPLSPLNSAPVGQNGFLEMPEDEKDA